MPGVIFDKYSRYYDLLYRDKNYDAEAAFVQQLIRKEAPEARSLLELGCGTGLHAAALAQRGYSIHGIDLSDEMLARARRRKSEKLSFARGDVRELRLGRKFDGVISLFHVVSYQTVDADLRAVFATAREHLHEGGVFVFDCWYGPAVLAERPSVRVKRMEDEAIRVTRIAEPKMHADECIVDVGYQVFVEDRATKAVEQLTELHRMRYLFRPEIETLAAGAGLRIVAACEWLTGKPLGEDTWSACFVARASRK
jgi:SAM-dependent methyltransferase